MIGYKVQRKRLQKEWHRLAGFYGERLSECLCAGFESILSLERAIHHWSLLYPSLAVKPVKGDMHCNVERPKRFSTFGRPPYDNQAFARNYALDQITRLRSQFDFINGISLIRDPGFRGVVSAPPWIT